MGKNEFEDPRKLKESIQKAKLLKEERYQEKGENNQTPFEKLQFYLLSFKKAIFDDYFHLTVGGESFLFLFCNVGTLLVAGLQFNIENTLFSSTFWATMTMCVLNVGAVLALRLVHYINQRHSILGSMKEFDHKSAVMSRILQATKQTKIDLIFTCISKVIAHQGLCFYISLVITQISYDSIPARTNLGPGTVQLVDFDSQRPKLFSRDLILQAIGARQVCSDCEGIRVGDQVLAPFGSILVDSGNVTSEVILEVNENILSIKTFCFEEDTAIEISTPGEIWFTSIALVGGIGQTMIDLEISSQHVETKKTISFRCKVVTKNYRGYTRKLYSNKSRRPILKNTMEITPLNRETCVEIGPVCLNDSKDTLLTYNVLASIFSPGSIKFNNQNSLNLALSANSGKKLNEINVSYRLSRWISIAMQLYSMQYPLGTATVDLFTEDQYIRLVSEGNYKAVTVGLAIFLAVYSIFRISIDLVSIEGLTETARKRLLRNLQYCSTHLRDISHFIDQLKKEGKSNHEILAAKARFGEVKSTVKQEIGFLRFGYENELKGVSEGKKYI